MRHHYHQKQKVAISEALAAIMGGNYNTLKDNQKKELAQKGKKYLKLQKALLDV